jgi:hypothetical protein
MDATTNISWCHAVYQQQVICLIVQAYHKRRRSLKMSHLDVKLLGIGLPYMRSYSQEPPKPHYPPIERNCNNPPYKQQSLSHLVMLVTLAV